MGYMTGSFDDQDLAGVYDYGGLIPCLLEYDNSGGFGWQREKSGGGIGHFAIWLETPNFTKVNWYRKT